ncbi:MAG TPA: hypothetical protein VJ915_10305 [Balneolaceae bacterium]|nr:hypothetical protein [Balneolaceae bacterium]
MANKLIKGGALYLLISLSILTLPPVSGAQDIAKSATDRDIDLNLTTLSYLIDTPGETIKKPEFILIQETSDDNDDRNTTSLTVGYIDDEFLIATDEGSDQFYFVGETAGAMISGKGANLMFAYGNADANGSDGEIRSLAADLSFGGNVHLFRNFLQLPVSIYVPIRLNAGYRNLSLVDEEDALHLLQAGIGAGAGASLRIPTGLPVLRDNLTGFASLVRSVGGLGELSSTVADQAGANDESAISGIRLMQNTDLNIEAKFERLLGENTGVTVGLTIRWQSWTEEKADEFLQLLDVVTGQQENLTERGKQTFLRVGINW